MFKKMLAWLGQPSESAPPKSVSRKTCFGCTKMWCSAYCNDCTDCTYGEHLTDCKKCRDCKNCQHCDDCVHCDTCVNCKDCNECIKCQVCEFCTDCRGCINCKGLVGRDGWTDNTPPKGAENEAARCQKCKHKQIQHHSVSVYRNDGSSPFDIF
jgi:hypothetical protein